MSKNIIEKIKGLFSAEQEPTKIHMKSVDGKILSANKFEADEALFELDEDGEIAIEDGTYVLEDGRSLVAEAGVIVEVIEAVEETSFEIGEITVIQSVEGEITVGDTVVTVNEDGEEVAVEDGEYEIDGVKFIVKDGLVAELVEAEEEEEEEAPAFEAAVFTLIEEQIANISTKYDEMLAKFEALEAENITLKAEVAKFAKSPSATPTVQKPKFDSKQSRLEFFSRR